MDLSLLILIAYVLVKALAYAGWCWIGVRAFAPGSRSPRLRALLLGVVRLLLGLGFGVGIFFASVALFSGLHEIHALDPTVSAVLTYGAIYVPVRWIEWALIEALLNAPSRSPAGFLLGPSGRARGWRLGGIAVSCLADVPLFLAVGGLPIGRFMC